jgi:hypothetical protein
MFPFQNLLYSLKKYIPISIIDNICFLFTFFRIPIPFLTKSELPQIKEKPYEYKYIEKYDLIKERKLENNAYIPGPNNFVFENTPHGIVIMYYDKEAESFSYYVDKKDIAYKYLETVARKYVIQNNCLPLFIDMRDELKRDPEKKDQEKEKKETSTQDVFAQFKKKKAKSQKNQQKKMKVMEPIKERANQYSFKGKLNEFSFLHKVDKQFVSDKMMGTANKPKNLSYDDFKKQYLS